MANTRNLAILLSLVTIILIPGLALGEDADQYWVGYQNDCMVAYPANASWFHGDNWWNFTNPDSTDTVHFGSGFDPAGGYYPTWIYFGGACVDVFSCPNEFQVPGGDARCETLIIYDDDFVFDFGSGNIGICDPEDTDPGSLTVLDWFTLGTWSSEVGQHGNASLEIRNGTFRCESTGHSGHIGSHDPFCSGELTVTGPNAVWEFTAGMQIGQWGRGTVNVFNGGQVDGEWSGLGNDDTGALGIINVDGVGSDLEYSSNLWVGGVGHGELNVTNGGDVIIGGGSNVGSHSEGSGLISVSGSGSSASWGGAIDVGERGTGELEVVQGGALGCNHLTTGRWPGSEGSIRVDGIGSSVTVYNVLHVGREAMGSAEITDHGFLSTGASVIGREAGAEGTVDVRGESVWGSYYLLEIGRKGTGTLNIDESAVSFAADAFVAKESGSTGELIVDGYEASFSCDEFLLGVGGSATATVSDRAVLSCRTAVLGDSASASAAMTVVDAESRFEATGQIAIGTLAANASLTLGAGTALSASDVVVGGLGELACAGTITAPGGLLNAGRLHPGASVGVCSVAGDYTQAATGALRIEVAGAEPGTGYDVLAVSGAVALAGSLIVSMDPGYEPPDPSAFEFITAASIAGEFDALILEGHPGALAYTDSSVVLWIGASVGVDESEDGPQPPARLALHPCAPNPFNPRTTIRYDVPQSSGRVVLRVYDAMGRLVRTFVDGPTEAGRHTVAWDGRAESGHAVSAGVYLVRLDSGSFSATEKVVLLK